MSDTANGAMDGAPAAVEATEAPSGDATNEKMRLKMEERRDLVKAEDGSQPAADADAEERPAAEAVETAEAAEDERPEAAESEVLDKTQSLDSGYPVDKPQSLEIAQPEVPDKPQNDSVVVFQNKTGQIQEDGPVLYRCTQGLIFVKRTENPESQRIIKVKKQVGAYVYGTGYTWTGPSGGVWMELDASRGEMGWMLVDGPGFGLKGPALVDAYELAECTSVQVVLMLSDDEAGIAFESVMSNTTKIGELLKLVAKQNGLRPPACALIKEPPAKIPGSDDRLTSDYAYPLQDDHTLKQEGCGDTCQLYLMYLEDFPDDFTRPKPIDAKTLKAFQKDRK